MPSYTCSEIPYPSSFKESSLVQEVRGCPLPKPCYAVIFTRGSPPTPPQSQGLKNIFQKVCAFQ
eukprot:1124744-Amphidinium_carterae.1